MGNAQPPVYIKKVPIPEPLKRVLKSELLFRDRQVVEKLLGSRLDGSSGMLVSDEDAAKKVTITTTTTLYKISKDYGGVTMSWSVERGFTAYRRVPRLVPLFKKRKYEIPSDEQIAQFKSDILKAAEADPKFAQDIEQQRQAMGL